MIDKFKFFNGYKEHIGRVRSDSLVHAIDALLDFMDADVHVNTNIPYMAYMLATTYHETAGTMKPINEYGKGRGRKYGVPHENGQTYFGRGYVQLTWAINYSKMSSILRREYPDLYDIEEFASDFMYDRPKLALQADIAYHIMSSGMRLGIFTGKKLDNYLNSTTIDYKGARRIINGTDKRTLIAGYANSFERILKGAIK
ncbi:hypothetical protein KAT92_05360 [Candidatus Babeliales bacterium]|nr:hypothetical protein [Candidatus Babeliales bacterium]